MTTPAILGLGGEIGKSKTIFYGYMGELSE